MRMSALTTVCMGIRSIHRPLFLAHASTFVIRHLLKPQQKEGLGISLGDEILVGIAKFDQMALSALSEKTYLIAATAVEN